MSKNITVGVLGLPLRSDGKILLTRRHAPGKKDWHNKWQLAGGGLEFGETTIDCLKREMWEELRVKVKRILYPQPITVTSIWYEDESKKKMNAHILLLSYIIDIGDQIPDLSQDPDWETNKFDWFSKKEALKLDCLPLTEDIVKEAYKIIDKNDII